MRVIGGSDIVIAIERHLREYLPKAVALLELDDLEPIETWQVVPTANAITTSKLPALAIVCSDMSQDPEKSGDKYNGVWQASVGVFDRGTDHADTQKTIADWAKAVRIAMIIAPLTGTGIRIRWTGEAYDLIPGRENARTIAGAEVMFDATVDVAVDLTDVPMLSGPPVESVHNNVTPQE